MTFAGVLFTILPEILHPLNAECIQSVHEKGEDLQKYMRDELRIIISKINNTLISLGSGPITEASQQ